MRILHVLPLLSARAGGPQLFATGAALSMRGLGVESTLFATDLAHVPSAFKARSVLLEELPQGIEELETRLFPTRPPRRLAYAPALGAALRRAVPEADVVHIHSLWLYPQFAAYRAARQGHRPYVVSPHGALDPFLRQRGRMRKALTTALWQRPMLEEAATIHVLTEEEAELIADIAPQVPRTIVPSGLDISAFTRLPDPRAFRQAHVGGHTGPIVLFLGRITFKKGIDVLIRAFALARPRLRDAKLVIVGSDDEALQPGLEALARELDVSAEVVFTGRVYREKRLAALAAADAWALSSHTENFGIAVVEALAAGVPTIVSPAVNIAKDIAAAGAGVVADLTPQAFADAIVSVLTDAEAAGRLAAAARSFAGQYDWSAIAPRLLELYRGVA